MWSIPSVCNHLFDDSEGAGGALAPTTPFPTVPTESRQSADFAGAGLIISASMVILTSSLTTTPPPSRLAFHFTPKSWRLTLVVALMAALEFPHGSFIAAVGASTSRTTSLVTP